MKLTYQSFMARYIIVGDYPILSTMCANHGQLWKYWSISNMAQITINVVCMYIKHTTQLFVVDFPHCIIKMLHGCKMSELVWNLCSTGNEISKIANASHYNFI